MTSRLRTAVACAVGHARAAAVTTTRYPSRALHRARLRPDRRCAVHLAEDGRRQAPAGIFQVPVAIEEGGSKGDYDNDTKGFSRQGAEARKKEALDGKTQTKTPPADNRFEHDIWGLIDGAEEWLRRKRPCPQRDLSLWIMLLPDEEEHVSIAFDAWAAKVDRWLETWHKAGWQRPLRAEDTQVFKTVDGVAMGLEFGNLGHRHLSGQKGRPGVFQRHGVPLNVSDRFPHYARGRERMLLKEMEEFRQKRAKAERKFHRLRGSASPRETHPTARPSPQPRAPSPSSQPGATGKSGEADSTGMVGRGPRSRSPREAWCCASTVRMARRARSGGRRSIRQKLPMTPDDAETLHAYEETIRENLQSFLEVGRADRRDQVATALSGQVRQLRRVLPERMGFRQSYAHRLVNGAVEVKRLEASPIGTAAANGNGAKRPDMRRG